MRNKPIPLLLLVLLVLFGLNFVPKIEDSIQETLYPMKYAEYVQASAEEYDLDPLLIYAFIHTESGFDPNARSNVDARGLMQITQITFDWLKPRVGGADDATFDNLYDPELNIRFGCYYIHRCLERYQGDVATAAASYHSGWGTVDGLLTSEAYSPDGQILTVFPYSQMNHYVAKITRAYAKYKEIYATEGV